MKTAQLSKNERRMIDEWVPCNSCGGKGTKQLIGYTIPILCPDCNGKGGWTYLPSASAVANIKQEIIASIETVDGDQ